MRLKFCFKGLIIVEYLFFFHFVGSAGEVVYDPPAIFLKFDCVTRTGEMGLEYLGEATNCVIARMFFDLSATNQKFCWKLQTSKIKTARESCKSNAVELASLDKLIGKMECIYFSD